MSVAVVVDLNQHRQSKPTGQDPVAALAIELGLDPATLTPTDRLWLAEASERVAFYRSKSRAENTLASYTYWCTRWERWCTDPSSRRRKQTSAVIDPWPATPAKIRLFLDDWVGDGYENSPDNDDDYAYQPPAPSTVSQVLSALRWKHRQNGHPDLADEILKELVKGYRRSWLEADFRVRRAEPLMLEDLLVICGWLQDHRIATHTLRDGAVVACYTSGLGLANTGRILISDLCIDDDTPLGVYSGDGDERQLHPFDDHARAAMTAWLDRYRNATGPIDEGAPLVPTVRPNGHITDAAPSRQQIRGVLRRVANTAGHPDWSTTNPITADLAEAMYRTCQQVDRAVVRDHSLILNAFWGALRRSEATGLDIKDVTIREEVGVTLELGITKNNQLGAKDSLAFVPIANGKGMDAVAVNTEWLKILHEIGDASPDQPFYRRISRTGVASTSGDDTPGRLDKGSVNAIIRRRLVDAGLATENPDDGSDLRDVSTFAGHSPRRGLITTLAEAGYETTEIARYSRHTDPSQLQVYVDKARLADPSRHPATTLRALREPPRP